MLHVPRFLILSLLILPCVASANEPNRDSNVVGIFQRIEAMPAARLLELLEANPGKRFRFVGNYTIGASGGISTTVRSMKASQVWEYAVRKAYEDVGRAFKALHSEKINSLKGLDFTSAANAANVKLEAAQAVAKKLVRIGTERFEPTLDKFRETFRKEGGAPSRDIIYPKVFSKTSVKELTTTSRRVTSGREFKLNRETIGKMPIGKEIKYSFGSQAVLEVKRTMHKVKLPLRGGYTYEAAEISRSRTGIAATGILRRSTKLRRLLKK